MHGKISKETEEAVIRDYNNGMKIVDIAKKHNIGRSTVGKIKKQNNVPTREYVNNRIYQYDDSEDLITDYNNGLSIIDLCIKYEMSSNTIYRILKENGIICNRKLILTKELEQEIAQMYVNGCYTKEIREKYNIGDSTLYRIIDKYDIPKRINLNNAKVIDKDTANNIINDYNNSTMSVEEIRVKYKLNSRDLDRLFKKYNIITRKSKRQCNDINIINDYKNKVPLKNICKKYSVSTGSIYNILRRNNIKSNRCR